MHVLLNSGHLIECKPEQCKESNIIEFMSRLCILCL